jgi:Tol biopolymer transport system component
MKKGEEKYYLFTDGQDDYRSFGDDFFRGGHPTFSPDGNWIATDAGDGKKKEKLVMLYSMKTGEGQVLGSFPMREYMSGDLRCDLHPRWNRAGNAVCFDALETKGWTRQLHVAQLEL